MSHRHAFRDEPYKCVEIPSASGIGVCLQPIDHGPGRDVSGGTWLRHPAGFIIGHDVPGQDYRCEGGLTIDDAHFPHRWTRTGTLEGGDLTLAPSVACTEHPAFHAYVQGGRWTG